MLYYNIAYCIVVYHIIWSSIKSAIPSRPTTPPRRATKDERACAMLWTRMSTFT